ncbi:hypothetical protein SASPL_141479 [Salvia splendens]|uniref:AAA+ ATPase At3g28540-like C-terminal domain-containing protein n=1 Tax=Salvia splendens TaxID=180675 RepID=A0A8X8WU39_SALSN|nr:hypothetical protein SASPL_141479 [Salvia splendens]
MAMPMNMPPASSIFSINSSSPSSTASSPAAVVIEERDGLSSNEIFYAAAETYLCTHLRFANSQTIVHDSHLGVPLHWCFVNEENKKRNKVLDEDSNHLVLESEKRYFNKDFKDTALDSYIPSIQNHSGGEKGRKDSHHIRRCFLHLLRLGLHQFGGRFEDEEDFVLVHTLRPGRMDMHIHMSYLTPDGFRLLASNYLENVIKMKNITPAEVAEELMKFDDVDLSLDEVLNFLKNKTNEEDDTKIISDIGMEVGVAKDQVTALNWDF